MRSWGEAAGAPTTFMRREDGLVHWHAETLKGLLNDIDHLMHHPAKYLDPDLSREPSKGKSLYERAEDEGRQILQDLPRLAASVPSMRYRFPTGLGESLDREDLSHLRQDIEVLIRYVRPGRN